MSQIKWFKDLTTKDSGFFGAKNVILADITLPLLKNGIKTPSGFVLSAEATRAFLENNDLRKKIKDILKKLDARDSGAVSKVSANVQRLIMRNDWPKDIERDVKKFLKSLSKNSVSVSSFLIDTDFPETHLSKQESDFHNIRGEKAILFALKKCLAAVFSGAAIIERDNKGVDQLGVGLALSVREDFDDKAIFGQVLSFDAESGFEGVLTLKSFSKRVSADDYDQFCVFKAGAKKGLNSIISRRFAGKGRSAQYRVGDEDILKISRRCIEVEDILNSPVVLNWAIDGKQNIYFTSVSKHSPAISDSGVIENYSLQKRGEILVQGVSVGQKIAQGKVRVVNSTKEMSEFKSGEVLVTKMTDADWEAVMRLASAVITQDGGKNSHAAIRARELGIPCVVGAQKATKILKNNQEVTVVANVGEAGLVYGGRLPFSVERSELKSLAPTRTKLLINMANPDSAFSMSRLPTDGVGLAREEFIFSNFVKVHPLALVNYKDIKDKKIKTKIDEITAGYKNKKQYGIDKLAEGLAFLASAFYPHDVQVRLSDFKSNEYASLVGGEQFEPTEDNPSMGWRGASRYYDPKYKSAFELECAAIKKARETWGLNNIIVTVPFCRTVDEGKKVIETMKEFGLEQGRHGLKIYVMCELPANVILAREFAKIFDGFSIGSNDLTQFTLGVDRDSSLMSGVYDENNLAVKKLIRQVIEAARENKRPVSICGEAVNDSAEFVEFLVQEGIDAISFNTDSMFKMRNRVRSVEKKLGAWHGGTQRMATALKSFLIVGVLGLSSILGGYGCQTINNQTVADSLKEQTRQQVLEMKAQLREEIAQEIAKNAPPQAYSLDSFVKLKLSYPASWGIDSWEDGVKFSAKDESKYFMIFSQKMGHPVPEEKISTTTWQSYPARRLTDTDQKDGTTYEVLEVYPSGYKDTENIIELRGDTATFEENLKKIEQFEIK